MNPLISQSSWHGQQAWMLENSAIRTVVVPELGAKLVSLFDKRTQCEWLVGPGNRPFKQVPYGASFVEQDMSGWDEMFPTIVECPYPSAGEYDGVVLPDHGEVWPLPWMREPSDTNALKFSVKGKALPYRLSRELNFSTADTLQMNYVLENLSGEEMPYIWAAHPQFVCNDGAEIVLPKQVTAVANVLPPDWGWGELETRFDWPEAINVDGQRVRIDQTGTAVRNQARKFYVPPETHVGWAGLIRQPANDWLRLNWNAGEVPYLGIWIDEGAISPESVVALEPATGFYDNLAVAWEKQQVTTIKPGAIKSWTLSVRLGTNDQPFDKR